MLCSRYKFEANVELNVIVLWSSEVTKITKRTKNKKKSLTRFLILDLFLFWCHESYTLMLIRVIDDLPWMCLTAYGVIYICFISLVA